MYTEESISFQQKMNRMAEESALKTAKKIYPKMTDIHFFTLHGITYISGAEYFADDNPMSRYYTLAIDGWSTQDPIWRDSNVVGREHMNKGKYHADNLPPIVMQYLSNQLAKVEKVFEFKNEDEKLHKELVPFHVKLSKMVKDLEPENIELLLNMGIEDILNGLKEYNDKYYKK